jgi:hypothetical protein
MGAGRAAWFSTRSRAGARCQSRLIQRVPGIVTGLPVAIAISASETAPLLRTAGWYPAQTHLGYDAAQLLSVLVLIVIVLGRVVVAISRRHPE